MKTALLAAAALAATMAATAADAPFAAAFMAGCWRAETAEAGSEEHWLAPAGGTMFGVSRTVRNGRTVGHEFMQIRAGDDGRLRFIAQPSGQREAAFVLVAHDSASVTFENPQHDFPQRIGYRAPADGRLAARIEGLRGGQWRAVDFGFVRTPCGGTAR